VAKRALESRRPIFLGLVVTLTFLVTLLALLFPVLNDLLEASLRIDEVAPYEINAPYSLTYASEILTTQKQDLAAQNVSPV
jgi:hypothetical protein